MELYSGINFFGSIIDFLMFAFTLAETQQHPNLIHLHLKNVFLGCFG